MSFEFDAFVRSAVVIWRESFEAILIVGILLGMLRKIDATEHRGRVWWGTAAGVIASIALGAALLTLADTLREQYEVVFEAVASLLAVAVLTYMIVWMYKHTMELMGGMHAKVRMALEAGTLGVLFLIPFFAVLREGFETVLFLAADSEASGSSLTAAFPVGVGLAAALGWLVFSGTLRLSVENFFAVTGTLLVLFAAWMLRYGVHEIGEAIEGSNHALGEALEGPVAWAAGAVYLVAMLFWAIRPIVRKAIAARRADSTVPE